jgi:hypothetical protein
VTASVTLNGGGDIASAGPVTVTAWLIKLKIFFVNYLVSNNVSVQRMNT